MFGSKKVTAAPCSWCFQKTGHTQLERNHLTRNVYTCDNCVRKTLKCRHPSCAAMARSLPDWDEELCYVHRRIISSWDDHKEIQKLNPEGYCSWCYEKTTHMSIQRNILRKHLYECLKCSRPTRECSSCKEFARDRGATGSSVCAQCIGSIASWTDVEANKKSVQKQAWCSFCYDLTTHFKINGEKHSCASCSQETYPCSSCSDGMCQSASMIGGNSCHRCKMEQKKAGSWNILQEKIANIKDESADGSFVEKSLTRNSEFKKLAKESGTIRPFLFLASMHPSMRIKFAILLGIDLPVADEFGDSHAESWLLINKDRFGIQARTNTTTETLNVVGKDADWYDTLLRVGNMTKSFKTYEGLSGKKKHEVCVNSANPFIAEFEYECLEALAQFQRQKMSPFLNQRIDELMGTVGAQHLAAKLAEGGIRDRPSLVRFLIETAILATSEVDFESKDEKVFQQIDLDRLVILLQEQMFSKGYFLTVARAQKIATVLGNVAFGRIIGSFFPVLGILNMASNILNAVFGSTVEKLQFPISMILTHELLLCSKGINISRFY